MNSTENPTTPVTMPLEATKSLQDAEEKTQSTPPKTKRAETLLNVDVENPAPLAQDIPPRAAPAEAHRPARRKQRSIGDSRRRPQKIALLGRGGFGEVWKVRYLNSEEAWKYLPRRPGEDSRAMREAVNARAIEHPNVVRVQDIEEDRDHYILRMDLVRGDDLHRIVNRDGVLTPETACRYAIQVAETLEVAHRASVLHLDLKPSNLILREDRETVMITDFGMSSTMGTVSWTPEERVGTPYFLAPEQLEKDCRTADLGPAVDIWALGVSFYYLLARRYPFEFKGNDPTVILRESPCPLPEVVPYVSDELWAIFERMLQRDPAQRFASMQEVWSAFSAHLYQISCPSCGDSFAVKDITGGCPGAGCEEPKRIVDLEERRSRMRSGDDNFARCQHEKAVDDYDIAASGRGARREESAELVARSTRLSKLAASAHEELVAAVETVTAALEAGELLRAVQEVDRLRTNFPGSSELCELRARAVDAVRSIHESVGEETAALVRGARFEEARELVATVQSQLDYEPLRRSLGTAKTDAETVPVVNLVNFVREEEAHHGEQTALLGAALHSLALGEAVLALQRLESRFPSPENLERIRLYTELAEHLEVVRSNDPEMLLTILGTSDNAMPPERVELRKLRELCDQILSGLDVSDTLDVKKVVGQRAAIDKCIELVLARRDRLQELMREAHEEHRPADELEALERWIDIAEKTDLIPAEDAARARGHHSELSQAIERSERKYAEARRLLEARDHERALLAFETAESHVPGLFPDIAKNIESCKRRIGENRSVRERLSQVYHRILGDAAEENDFVDYIEMVRDAEENQDQRSREDVSAKTRRVLKKLLECRSAEIETTEDDEERLTVLSRTIELLGELPRHVLVESFARDAAELQDGLTDLVKRIVAHLGRRTSMSDTEDCIRILDEILGQLVQIRDIVRELRPRESERHPAELVSAGLVTTARVVADCAEESATRLQRICSLQTQLFDLSTDPQTHRGLEEDRAQLRKLLRPATWRSAHWKMLTWCMKAWVPTAALIVITPVLMVFFQRQVGDNRVAIAQNAVVPLLGDGIDATVLADFELPPDVRARVRRSNAGFASFLAPLLAIDRSRTGDVDGESENVKDGKHRIAPPPAAEAKPASTTDELARRLQRLSWELDGLHSIASSSESSEGDKWNRMLDSRRRQLRRVADAEISAFLETRIEGVVESALAIDPDADPWRWFDELESDIDAALRLGNNVDAREPDGKTLGALRTAGMWKVWLSETRTAIRQAVDGETETLVVSDPQNDALLLAGHLGYIGLLARDVVRKNQALYWGGETPEDIESFLHDSARRLLAYRSRLAAEAETRPAFNRLTEFRFTPREEKQDPLGIGLRQRVMEMVVPRG